MQDNTLQSQVPKKPEAPVESRPSSLKINSNTSSAPLKSDPPITAKRVLRPDEIDTPASPLTPASIRVQWPKLSADDVKSIHSKDDLAARISDRYNVSRSAALAMIDTWGGNV